MDTKLLKNLFGAMLKGKSFRLTKECRNEIRDVFAGAVFSDTWFTIESIDCIGKITLCGNRNTTLRGRSPLDILTPESWKEPIKS